MSSAIDLITNARARVALPSAAASGSDDTAINTLITACSRAIQRHCHRWLVAQDFDELYNGNANRRLPLRNYPLQKIASVRYRPVTVLKITNNLAGTPQARVSVTSTGLTLTRVTNGVTTTDTSITFAGNVTLVALQAAVNALGSGWSAAGQGYDSWPSADLWCPNGPTSDPYYTPAGQGALQCVAGAYAELKLHTYELSGYQYDQRQGWLLRAIPYSDPELLHPEDLIFPPGINNFRVQYTAGYTSIPDDLQEACAQLVAYHFRLGPRETPDVFIPPVIQQYLATYRRHPLTITGG
jgi:hypothetical protein